MKRIIIPVILILIAGHSHAQSANGSSRSSYGSYYGPIWWGPNGYRTVEQENKLMEEQLAEMRRQREREEGTPQDIARANKKQAEELAAKQKKLEGKNRVPAKTRGR